MIKLFYKKQAFSVGLTKTHDSMDEVTEQGKRPLRHIVMTTLKES
ncbi:MAG: hypothetical protein ACRCY6_02095 [Bacteroidales bacterium]